MSASIRKGFPLTREQISRYMGHYMSLEYYNACCLPSPLTKIIILHKATDLNTKMSQKTYDFALYSRWSDIFRSTNRYWTPIRILVVNTQKIYDL